MAPTRGGRDVERGNNNIFGPGVLYDADGNPIGFGRPNRPGRPGAAEDLVPDSLGFGVGRGRPQTPSSPSGPSNQSSGGKRKKGKVSKALRKVFRRKKK